MILNKVGAALKEARGKTNQKELSVKSGVAQSTISDVENGKVEVCVITLDKLASALGLELEIKFKKKS